MTEPDGQTPRADGAATANTNEPPTAATSMATPRRAAKKAARKAVKKAAPAKKAPAKRAASGTQPAKYPRHSVERSLRIPQAIYDQNGGNPATPKEAVQYTGGGSVSGAFQLEISSSKKYGFLEPADGGKLAITARARKAIAPQSEGDRLSALREAVLAAPDISEVYSFYRGENLPDNQFLINALTDKFKIPADKVAEFLQIFNDSIRSAELLDTSGDRPRLIDVGRDETHRAVPGKPPAKASVSPGTTCFVMQPFAAPLGGYYEVIFKPAIEQAGLTALRADAEIFGTGKVIDQIWRGIQGASVLIAELTTKNANVFYELGLAHALEKPVVLVSSNQDDVPFDLKHIRVILYDQSDPFWGQKLIDKIADNIKSAISNPEDAIFRIDKVDA